MSDADWRAVKQDYDKKMSLSNAAGLKDRGMVTRAGVRDIKWSDMLPNTKGSPTEDSLGPIDVISGKISGAMNPDHLGGKVVTMGTSTGKPVNIRGSDLESDPQSAQAVDQLIRQLRSQGDPDSLAKARKYEQLYNTTFRR